jgi:hypothetical protein
MVQPAEQLDDVPQNLYDRLIAVMQEMQNEPSEESDLPSIEITGTEGNLLEEIRIKIRFLFE